MAKKKAKKKVSKKTRKNPGRPKAKKKARRNPKTIRAATSAIRKTVPDALYIAGGLLGSRVAVNVALPNATGYVRAGVQAATGIAMNLIAGKLAPRNKRLGAGLLMGAMVSALFTLADTLTGSKYNLGYEYTRLPMTADAYLPSGMADTYVTAGSIMPALTESSSFYGIPMAVGW